VRQYCGFFALDSWCLVESTGKDLLSYLQTQTTNDIQALETGQGQNSAIVDRKARIIATFSLHKTAENTVLFIIEACQKEALLKHLESFIFREEVHFSQPALSLLTVQGPLSPQTLQNIFGSSVAEKPSAISQHKFRDGKIWVINKSFTGEEGFILAFGPSHKSDLEDALMAQESKFPPRPFSAETFDALRIEAGIPLFNKDLDGKNILPETGLEHSSVSYNKGCYIGQEVIARIKTYGAPNFALMGLCGDQPFPMDGEIRLGSKKIGQVKSSTWSASLEKQIALAYMQKDHRSPDVNLEVSIDGRPFQVKTCLLPFYQPQTRKDRSKNILDQALKIYKEQENLDSPINLLREAIAIDPTHAAAYEALGVFLSKQNKLDEAIALMKRLVELDPGEIMAHSNLSIYYMQQGRIEDAEREKGEATAIQFERIVEENMAKNKNAADREQAEKDRENKIEMFKKVLEIDAVDQIANFGLGSIYYESNQADQALPHLETVVKEYKDYSAAYLLLGKVLEKISRPQRAEEVYRQGIAAASKKGDLMPLREMQTRLNQLLQSSD